MMINTYKPVIESTTDEIGRADAFYRVCVWSGLGTLFVGVGLSMFTHEWWPFGVTAAIFAGVLIYGVVRHEQIATAPVKANIAEAQKQMAHARRIELIDAQASADERRAIAQARISLAAQVAPQAAPVAVKNGGRVIGSFQVTQPVDVVELPDGRTCKLELVQAMARHWPTTRRELQSWGIQFATTEYSAAVAAFGLFDVTDPAGARSAVSMMRYGVWPSPALLEPAEIGQ
jgi:hypothetical protein